MTTQASDSVAVSVRTETDCVAPAGVLEREANGSASLSAAWRTLLVWCCVLVLIRFGPASLLRLYSAGKDKAGHTQFDGLNFQVDINVADAAELQTLEGIGPALAERIVQNRQQYGPFQSVADLRRVAGFGEKRVEQLAPYVVIDLDRIDALSRRNAP